VKEYLFQDARINCYIQQKGASVFELDYLPKDWNYLDCGSCGCAKDRRTAFADVLSPVQTDFKNGFPQGSRLCFNEQFEEVLQDRKGKSSFKLPVSGADIPYGGIELEKCYLLKKDVLSVNYVLKNSGEAPENFTLVTEIDFSFAGSGEEFARFYTTDPEGKDVAAEVVLNNAESLKTEGLKAEGFKILDINNEVQLLLGSAKPFSGCLLSAVEGGYYQANRILMQFAISLEIGESWTNEFSLKFSH
ncbi:MAG: hypothetical protein LBI04_07595, partial [Treponema sp.]|nr:hypothetical protein [Treponema sp.]